MKDYTRLFDILNFQHAHYPLKDALNKKRDGKWTNYSTQECVGLVNGVSKSLYELGVQPGDKIVIVSENRPEWNFVDNGLMQIGAINVPVYPTISESDYKYIFNESEISYCFVSDAELLKKIRSIENEVPTLKEIFSFDEIDGVRSFNEFIEIGKDVDMVHIEERAKPIAETDLASIIYTSGTTGEPKGVMLSHKNIISNIKSALQVFPVANGDVTLSFLPLCHIFERVVTYAYLAVGASVYYAESLETIGEDLKDVKPHYFSSVPRLLEKVYDKIVAKGEQQTGIKKKLFFWALDLGLKYEPGYENKLKYKLADKIIFSKWREALGGRVKGILTGAAALQERLGRVFSCAGIPVREAYGQTETSPGISINGFEEGEYKFGTVGPVISGVEVKIANDGEILVRGDNVMLGYYKKPEETARTIKDGWLHTGDKGEFDGKFLKITGRVKEIFKTSGGKYVAPQAIENKMKESPYIEQLCVLGENQKFVSALIVPMYDNVIEWAKEKGLNINTREELLSSQAVSDLINNEIDRLNQGLGQISKIKAYRIVTSEWSINSGELTPTMKVKRKVVLGRYESLINEIYN